ncbi:murein DD-endopeptidase MepM/ murein hydrolase activator NlpD [Paenibacillus mucilaginosus]|uniref:aggregation-promoting factor C-terminal-like domain-containing protein n=1 Tax=Paenibacillus mucilaginosus TaxID=61624 RepID=UPI003D262A4A
MSSQELGEQAGQQAEAAAKRAGAKLTRQLANKTAGRAAKLLKRLAVSLIKKIVGAAFKAILATLGPYGILVLIGVFLFLVVLESIPSSDYYLKGGQRTAEEEIADKRYELTFRQLADDSVNPIDEEDASFEWKEQLKTMVKPNWAIPASFSRYELIRSSVKIDLPDPVAMYENLVPTFSYQTITDDKLYTKTIKACWHEETWTDEEGVEHSHTVHEPPVETIEESTLPARKIMSRVETPFGTTDLPSAIRYYPGGTYEPNGAWEPAGSGSGGNCTWETSTRSEKTMIDDRGVPLVNLDAQRFRAFVVSRGVEDKNFNEFMELVVATDPYFPVELYKGEYLAGEGLFSDADYFYSGGVSPDGWVWPIAIDYRGINSGFGPRWGKFHYGVDLGGRAWPNAPILAAKDGVVVFARANSSYGNQVMIAHDNGLQTRYAHMSAITVKEGQQVTAGQQIGKQGSTGDSTGPHLHFEVIQPDPSAPFKSPKNGGKAFDPMTWLGPIKNGFPTGPSLPSGPYTNYYKAERDRKGNPGAYQVAYNALSQAITELKLPQEWLKPSLELVARESSFNPQAANPNSSARGYFQFLDATRRQFGGLSLDWNSPIVQSKAGLMYVIKRYRTPEDALRHWDEHKWF